MIDNKTGHLKLPLPHEDNLLQDDVMRLIDAFTGIDGYAKATDAALAKKAEASQMDAGLAGKADKNAVETSLALKADASALRALQNAKAVKLVSKGDSGRAAIAEGDAFAVPSYVVGSGKLLVSLEGCACIEGEQYSETGAAGAVSTSIKWLCAVPVDFTINIIVLP